jgi:cobyrinic acid a,c-diamide synthase
LTVVMTAAFPRVLLAGLGGDTGKSLVSLGLAAALRKRGLAVAPFKKGPDFIDAAWLGAAAGTAGRNLDTFLMPEEAILNSLRRASMNAGIAIIEGNRGLFDGLDARGSHSTAHLAGLTGTPVVLVVDATKVTRTVAAMVLGCRAMDPSLRLAGVILNKVGTARQEAVIREAVGRETGIPVLGAIPRLPIERLPSRHLGLVTTAEHPDVAETLEALGDVVSRRVDIGALMEVAGTADDLGPPTDGGVKKSGRVRARIGVLKDRAFSFYYPENLSALEEAGAELEYISPTSDGRLPAVDAVYAGGGFPEEHAEALSRNDGFRSALRKRIEDGMPVWAECGGLMYLADALSTGGRTWPMVGALPVTVEQTGRPQGHGYVQAQVDGRNPFLSEQSDVRGHEFHYSRLGGGTGGLETVMSLSRGVGVGGGRDGIRSRRVVAGYTHVHALGTPQWAEGLVRAAEGGAAWA